MPPRITLVFLIAALGLSAIAQEEKPASEHDGSELLFYSRDMPSSVFSTIDPSNRDGARKPKPGVLQIKGANQGELDVTKFLSLYGVSFPPGSNAVYNGALIVRNTAPNLALVERIFGKKRVGISPLALSAELSTYECTLPVTKTLLPWDELTFTDMQNLPRGSLKLLDRTSIAAKSGQRSVSNHVIKHTVRNRAKIGASDDGEEPVFRAGETGSKLEVEPAVGSDDMTMDISLSFHLRTQSSNVDGSGVELNVTTFFTTWSDYPLVIHSAPVYNQPGKYLVVVSRIKVSDVDEWKLPPPKPGLKPGIIAVVPKTAGQNQPPLLSLRRYKIPPGFFTAQHPDGTHEQMDIEKFFKDMGVSFPPGSSATYDKKTNSLNIINTPENLDLTDEIVETRDYNNANMVSAEISAYECDFQEIQDSRRLEKLTFAELEKRPRDTVSLLDCVSVVTMSGAVARTSDVASPDISKDTGADPQQALRKFKAGETGTIMRVEPVMGPDGKKVDAIAEFHLRMKTGNPAGKEITEVNGNVTFTSESGVPQVVHVSPVKNQNGKYIVVVMRMRVLNPGGWNVKPAGNVPQQTPAPSVSISQ